MQNLEPIAKIAKSQKKAFPSFPSQCRVGSGRDSAAVLEVSPSSSRPRDRWWLPSVLLLTFDSYFGVIDFLKCLHFGFEDIFLRRKRNSFHRWSVILLLVQLHLIRKEYFSNSELSGLCWCFSLPAFFVHCSEKQVQLWQGLKNL